LYSYSAILDDIYNFLLGIRIKHKISDAKNAVIVAVIIGAAALPYDSMINPMEKDNTI